MAKKKRKSIPKRIIKRLIYPPNTWRLIRGSRNKKRRAAVRNNAQLQLYSELLPGDFLHYGYFEDPQRAPETISLQDIYDAQLRYAELLVDLIDKNTRTVLDAGCGMGGLLRLLRERNFEPVGLTPDQFQIDYLRDKYPDISLVHAKFEEIDIAQYTNHFDTVIHSESLQYMNLDDAIAIVQKILKPGGRWIVADYFRESEAVEKSGFYWNQFQKKLNDGGFKLTHEQDITPNIRPTLGYIHMWGNNIGFPIVNFYRAEACRQTAGVLPDDRRYYSGSKRRFASSVGDCQPGDLRADQEVFAVAD